MRAPPGEVVCRPWYRGRVNTGRPPTKAWWAAGGALVIAAVRRQASDRQRAHGRGDRAGQRGDPGQVLVDRGGGGAALGDRPDDQRLAAPSVSGDEDVVDVGAVLAVALDVAALVELQPELTDQSVVLLGAGEAHGEQHELRRDFPLGARDRVEPAVLEDDL